MKYKIKLLKKYEVAVNTIALEFEKPAGFEFRAGQFCEWKLIDPKFQGAVNEVRPFSLASAPFEKNLMLATRLRATAFKNSLKELSVGETVEMDGPFGALILHVRSERPAVILTGGIGITPFRSIIKQAIHENLPHKIFLFYSNRRPEDAPFLKELENVAQENPNFRMIATMTAVEKSELARPGERGRLNWDLIARHIDIGSNPVYYSAGPPQLTAGLWQVLKSSGVSEDDIKTEEFPGY